MPEPEEPKGKRDLVNALNVTLYNVLRRRGEIANVEITFDMPRRDWPLSGTGDKPTLNLFLYDIRENPDMRREHPGLLSNQRVGVHLSYMITCWGGTPAEQHRILWAAIEQLYRFSPLRNGTGKGEDFVHEYLRRMIPIRTDVARADGAMRNVSEFWSALGTQIRPAINFVAMLDLELPAGDAERPTQTKQIRIDVTQTLRYRVGLRILKKNESDWEAISENAKVTIARVHANSRPPSEIPILRQGEGIFQAAYLAPDIYRLSVQLPKQNSDEFLATHTTEFEVSARQPEESPDRMYAFGVNNEGQFIDVPDGAKGW